MENIEQEITLDIRDILRIIRKRLWLIISISIIAALLGGIVSVYYLKPKYEAEISVVIGKIYDKSQENTIDEYNDVMMYQSLLKTYAIIAQSKTVSNKATNLLSLKYNKKPTDLDLGSLTVTPQTDTQIMDIKVRNLVPQMAKDSVEAISQAFMEEAARIYPNGNVQIIDPADLPVSPVSPNKKLNVMISFFLGMMASMGLSFLLEFMDNTLKNESSVEKFIGIPVIGVIPKRN